MTKDKIMAAKQMKFGTDARAEIGNGLSQLSRAVKATLGPRGRNVVLHKSWGSPRITKDGVTVSKEIELPQPFENMGAKLINMVASKTGDVAGDGTTTAVVLAEAIYREGLKYTTAGVNPVLIQRGILKAAEVAGEAIASQSKKVKGREDYKRVATISANGDEHIGDLMADAMEKVGKEGVITVDEGKSTETVLEYTEGMQFDKGYLSPYFMTNPTTLEAVLENAYILLHEKKISNLAELLPLLNKIVTGGRPLLIIAEDVEGLRPGEASGAPGEDHGRGGGDPRWRRDGDGDEGAEGPDRRRAARDSRGGRGRDCPRRGSGVPPCYRRGRSRQGQGQGRR